METLLSNRVKSMKESATLKMSALARQIKSEGHDVIALSIGEPDFDTPASIKEAAKTALDDGYTKYTPVPGLPALREAICTKLKRDNDLEYSPDQIVVSNGAKQSIANVVAALINDGDEVILFTPYWVSYIEIVRLNGGIPIELSAGIEADYKVTAQQLQNTISEKTKLVIFSSPCNPTGSVYNGHELEAIADVIAGHENVIVVSDEIYEYINFTTGHVSLASFASIYDRVVTVNGMSKGFSMTGWRLGYIAAHKTLAKACAKIQGQNTSGATAFGQMAAKHALLNAKNEALEMTQTFKKRRDMFVSLLDELEGFKVNYPHGAFYVFPEISYFFGKSYNGHIINSADDFAMFLLHNAHVAVVSGAAFGAPTCIRISYAASDDRLQEAVRRMKEAIQMLA